MNLNSSLSESGDLIIEKGDAETIKSFSHELESSDFNQKTQTANIINSKVTINGKMIENENEQYPLLRFRGITYFPLTWRFAVEEFEWRYSFDNISGLTISADNYFYYDNYFATYIKGDLKILMRVDTNRLGPIKDNLRIIKNGVEKKPEGYFGYYQEKGPLFTVSGGDIYTTQVITPNYSDYFLMIENYEARIPKHCRVNIDTGHVFDVP
jgi:hypothetical protein